MSGFNNWIGQNFSKKPGFWWFQIIGWLTLIVLQNYLEYSTLSGLKDMLHWTSGNLFGFLVTLLLRIIYKWFYLRRLSIYRIFLIMCSCSLFGAFIWMIANNFVVIPFLNTLLKSNFEAVNFKILNDVINRIFYMSFPVVIWSLLYFGIKFWIDLLNERDRGEKSLLLAQTAQLSMLRYQLNPHFLFNSLSSIQALIYDDPKKADIILTKLSDFLRFTIQDIDKLYIPLKEEVEIVEKYLTIEKTRFPDRLSYTIDVTKSAYEYEVAAFILQPFVENAVKYGMKTSPEALKIKIKGFVEDARLYIQISNSGKWIEPDSNDGTGIKNVTERLKLAYPKNFEISINKGIESVIITIKISKT